MKIEELIELQIKKDPENRLIHEFKLGSFCYNDTLELMAIRLLHFYYLKNMDSNGYYIYFCELYGYNHDIVECMIYAFDNSDYFDCGTSPRGQWMNEIGRKIYEKYIKDIIE